MQRMRAQQRRRREVRRVVDEHTNCGRTAREVSRKALLVEAKQRTRNARRRRHLSFPQL